MKVQQRIGLVAVLACGLSVLADAAEQTSAGPQTQRPQPTSVADVRALLRSSSLRDNAWGAWWAGERGMRELEPDLRATLRVSLESSAVGFDRDVAIDDTLDALIRFGSNALPIEAIADVYALPSRQPEALILLAQSSMPRGDADRFLLTVVRQKAGVWRWMNWFAAADLLLAHRTPGLAAAVLQDLTFSAHVVICAQLDGCRFAPPGYGGSWSGGVPDASLPPWVHYILMKPGTTGTPLVNGPTPETSMAFGRYVGLLMPPGPPWPSAAAECLKVIAGAVPQISLPPIDGEILRVETRASGVYDDVITTFRRDLEARYAAMLRSLMNGGALTAAEVEVLAVPRLSIAAEQGIVSR